MFATGSPKSVQNFLKNQSLPGCDADIFVILLTFLTNYYRGFYTKLRHLKNERNKKKEMKKKMKILKMTDMKRKM